MFADLYVAFAYLVHFTVGMPFDAAKISAARRLTEDSAGRRLRVRARLSVAELAADIGVSPSTLSRWETGATVPGPALAQHWFDTLQRIENQELQL